MHILDPQFVDAARTHTTSIFDTTILSAVLQNECVFFIDNL